MQSKKLYLEQKLFLRDLLKDMDRLEQKNDEFYSKYSKILKAQFILMLYTTLESVVIQSIQDIFDKITEEKTHFYSLNKHFQKLYIKAKIKNKERDFNQVLGDEDFLTLLCKLNNKKNIASIECKKDFEGENPFKAGSLNIKIINKEILKKIGIDCDESKIDQYCRKLKCNIRCKISNISDNRNKLAHGEISFQDCGRNISIKDLRESYISLFSYLSYYLKIIANYIQSRSYLNNEKVGKENI